MPLTISFTGGAGTVTGSRHLIDTGRTRVLIDCGQFQGEKQLREMNWSPPPFDPRSIDAVVLTHAHIDHSGMLPRLVAAGFRGPIYATPATIALAEILLLDAAELQEEDAAYANRKGFSRHRPALPLFTVDDTKRAMRSFRPLPYAKDVKVGDLRVRLHNAGHILGSAHAEVTTTSGQPHTMVFSGDLGRYGVPLHRDPEPPPACDTLVMEATYGDRIHNEAPLDDQLGDALEETLRGRGTVLIPAFAVARAQLITLILGRMMASRRLQRVPVHIDSPMAVDVTDTYRRFSDHNHLDDDIKATGTNSLMPPGVQFHRTQRESMALNDLPGPRIIISSSGMLAGGRVLHHLRRLAPEPENLILLAGYQAVGTRGRDLAEGKRTVRVHGMDVFVRAKVEQLGGFSAHADQHELLRWAQSGSAMPRTVFLVHGEPEAAEELQAKFAEAGVAARAPYLGQQFSLGTGGWTPVSHG
jgi:metallo-beta-lactamase family protein